jgi:hypothetical protein|tara:strand:- start:111 stop:347 length:237 start_codon:yes stop_codon:yes gene_type:complete
MKSRDFVIWVDGFIEGKINLGVDEIRHIKNKITEVDLNEEKPIIIRRDSSPTMPITIKEPNTDDFGQDFPGRPPNVYM